MQPLTIFISGPITNGGTADEMTMWRNVADGVNAEIECIHKGHYPFLPHLSVMTNYVAEKQERPINWGRWMAIDHAFLCKCDAILFLGSSKGSEIELSQARDYGLKIYYSVDEIPVVEVEE